MDNFFYFVIQVFTVIFN